MGSKYDLLKSLASSVCLIALIASLGESKKDMDPQTLTINTGGNGAGSVGATTSSSGGAAGGGGGGGGGGGSSSSGSMSSGSSGSSSSSSSSNGPSNPSGSNSHPFNSQSFQHQLVTNVGFNQQPFSQQRGFGQFGEQDPPSQQFLGIADATNQESEPESLCECHHQTLGARIQNNHELDPQLAELDCRLRCAGHTVGSLFNFPDQQTDLESQADQQATTSPMDEQLGLGAQSMFVAASSSIPSAFGADLVTGGAGSTMTLLSSTASSVPIGASSTLSPSAKMNPNDISFFLFTRQNRFRMIGPADLMASSLLDTGPTGPMVVASKGAANADADINQLQGGDLLDANNETGLLESSLNSSLPIKIIIHGFGSGGRRPWVSDMVSKLLDFEDANVIVVDWEKGAALPNYVQAAGNTRLVGHKIASLIRAINLSHKIRGDSYHLIGFSLGAHAAGFAGMEIRNSTRWWLARITGLDPASPLFEGYEANDRLDPSDAQFVDVIHSNGDGVLRGGFGSLQPMGHVDFYPNGGRVQVGCNSVLLSALSDIIYGKWQSLCNHRRALNFFMDSFEFDKCKFRSFQCDSYENYLRGECFTCGQYHDKCSYMGYLANNSKGRGKMYLTTHENAPFCANQLIIKIVGTKGWRTNWGKIEVTLVSVDGRNETFWLSSSSHQARQSQDSSLGQDFVSSGGSNIPSPGPSLAAAMSQQQRDAGQQHSMQSLIVAHPSLVNFTSVLLRYTRYKGWIYSGDESWSIDKVLIMDSDGLVKSFCGFNTILESHITISLRLQPGNCTLTTNATGAPDASVELTSNAKLVTQSADQQMQQQPPQQQQQQHLQQQQQQQQQGSSATSPAHRQASLVQLPSSQVTQQQQQQQINQPQSGTQQDVPELHLVGELPRQQDGRAPRLLVHKLAGHASQSNPLLDLQAILKLYAAPSSFNQQQQQQQSQQQQQQQSPGLQVGQPHPRVSRRNLLELNGRQSVWPLRAPPNDFVIFLSPLVLV